MNKIKKHIYKKWEVSIVDLKNNGDKKFKVTRRIPELSVAETKFFRTKEEAKKQFDVLENFKEIFGTPKIPKEFFSEWLK